MCGMSCQVIFTVLIDLDSVKVVNNGLLQIRSQTT